MQFDINKEFTVYSSFTLSLDDLDVINLLYEPLIGKDAVSLYLTLSSMINRRNMRSEKMSHRCYFDLYSLKQITFLHARYKLEGIGLLNTYSDNNDQFIYLLCAPLTAKNFLKDAILGLYLYSQLSKESFDFITSHFKIEKLEKSSLNNITKTFDEVYTSKIEKQQTYEKFQYLLGKKPGKSIKIKNNSFDFDKFLNQIDKNLLEMGVTKTFEEQIKNLAFVYGFDEYDMAGLYGDSINHSCYYDYKLLKKKANVLFNYKKNMKGPLLNEKDEDDVKDDDLASYLENTSPSELLEDALGDYPVRYLETINKIYTTINLPKGVLNAMIIKILKDKSGEMPSCAYFEKVSQSWIADGILSTLDAIRYVTGAKVSNKEEKTLEEEGIIIKRL